MRLVLLLALVGCTREGSAYPMGDDNPPNHGQGDDGTCANGDDSMCATGTVCTRPGVCASADDVYAVRITWTVAGQPASATSCAAAPLLELDLIDGTEGAVDYGYIDVACMEGVFNIDKIGKWIDEVQLYPVHGPRPASPTPIDPATGLATLDLAP